MKFAIVEIVNFVPANKAIVTLIVILYIIFMCIMLFLV